MQGDPQNMAQAIYIISSAVDRYKELCEGRYKGEGHCSRCLRHMHAAWVRIHVTGHALMQAGMGTAWPAGPHHCTGTFCCGHTAAAHQPPAW